MKLEPLEELRNRATAGEVDAQIRMGNRYLCGVTVEVDLDEAAKWFLLAGKSGSADGFMSLGLHYSGSAKPRDVVKAMHFYEKAAKLGHVDAQLNLGRFYFVGDGVEQDYVKARKWIQKAAAQGSPQGYFLMGALYFDGLGVKQDTKKAADYYELSIAGGYACAMHNLGCMHYFGQGIEVDAGKASELFRLGANLNHPPCLCNLGACYSLGRGVDIDEREGLRLYREAAVRGYAVAQANLAAAFALGQGCKKDIPLSYAWAKIAEEVSANARKLLAGELKSVTPAQRAAGEKLILKLRKEMAAIEPLEFPFINDGN
jgi:TPR repeat protein